VNPSILGRGAALNGFESQGANADAMGPTTDMADQQFVLVNPATLDFRNCEDAMGLAARG
jgi:hypothetical protein